MLVLNGRKAYRVAGDSMLPTLKSGDIVLTDPRAEIYVGDIVAADHPYKQSVKLIKRVESIRPDGRYILVGDNLGESTDSRQFGTIARRNIAGKVVCRSDSRFINGFLAHRP
jgi:nickel-type superoxide dismutase maturation protease